MESIFLWDTTVLHCYTSPPQGIFFLSNAASCHTPKLLPHGLSVPVTTFSFASLCLYTSYSDHSVLSSLSSTGKNSQSSLQNQFTVPFPPEVSPHPLCSPSPLSIWSPSPFQNCSHLATFFSLKNFLNSFLFQLSPTLQAESVQNHLGSFSKLPMHGGSCPASFKSSSGGSLSKSNSSDFLNACCQASTELSHLRALSSHFLTEMGNPRGSRHHFLTGSET